MCIILTCEKNVRPDYDLIEDCFFSNPDGAGLMWVEDGRVETSKGFTDPSKLMSCIESVPMDVPMVIHMRIATSGGIDTGTCHPFPIAKSLEVLHAANTECDAAIAHNGIISGMPTDSKRGISDTVSFVMNVIAPKFRGRVTRNFKKLIRSTAPGNRFAILTKDGKVSRIGDGWETVSPGIHASNGSWRYMSFGTKLGDYDPSFDVYLSDDVCGMAYIEASRIACDECTLCKGCKEIGNCKAYGPACDEVMYLAEMYEQDLIEQAYEGVVECKRWRSYERDSVDYGWKEGWYDYSFVE